MVKAFNREFDGKAWTEYKGLSNDPRPLSPKAGDVFMETDTLDSYQFNGYLWELAPLYSSGSSSGATIYKFSWKPSKEKSESSNSPTAFGISSIPDVPVDDGEEYVILRFEQKRSGSEMHEFEFLNGIYDKNNHYIMLRRDRTKSSNTAATIRTTDTLTIWFAKVKEVSERTQTGDTQIDTEPSR